MERKREEGREAAERAAGPVTVTNTKTGEVTVHAPYTPKQVNSVDGWGEQRPKLSSANQIEHSKAWHPSRGPVEET